jgi:SnoaL-like domain
MIGAMLELQEISDRLELMDLMVRYSHAVDNRAWDDFDQIFTADAVIDYTVFGGPRGTVPEIKEYLATTLAAFPAFQHLVANPELRIDGDTATGRTMCFNPMGVARPEGEQGDPRVFFCGLWYLDQFVRTTDGWRIHERVEEKSWVHNMGRAFGGSRD